MRSPAGVSFPGVSIAHVVAGLFLCGFPVPPTFAQSWTSAGGPPGGQVRTVAIENGVCLAGTPRGLYRSTDQGATWVLVTGGLPADVFVNDAITDGSRFFISTGLGVFVSDDQGASWTISDQGIEGVGMNELAAGESGLYALSGQIFGSSNLFRSTDAGSSWALIPSPPTPFSSIVDVDGVLVAPSAALLSMFRSTDNGATWQEADAGLPLFEFYETLATSDGVVFAGSDRSGLFRSTDTGVSWTAINTGISQPFASVNDLAADGATLLAATWGDGVFRTTNGGLNWAAANSGLPGGWGAYLLGVGLEGSTSLAGLLQDAVYRSEDAGASWSEPAVGLASTSPRSLVRSAIGTTIVTAGGDRIFRTTDAGETWTNTQSGIPPQAQLIALGRHGNALFAGTQYEGIVRSLDDGATWSTVNSGYPIYNGTAGNQYREVGAFASAGGSIFVGTGSGIEMIDGNFQITGEGVFRSTNNGSNWQPANPGFPIIGTDNFGETRYDPVISMGAGASTIFASTFDHGVFRSTNGGSSWVAANTGLPQNGSRFPEFSGFVEHDGAVFAGSIGFSAGSGGLGLFRSTSQGASWSLANNGIPANRRVRGLHVDAGILYASIVGASAPLADDGVYRSTDSGASWQKLGDGVESLGVSALLAVDTRLLVATSGFGAWRFDLLEPASVEDVVAETAISLGSPIPNPVRQASSVTFELGAPQAVRLTLHDATGRLRSVIAEGAFAAGTHRATVSAGDLPQGVYWLRIERIGVDGSGTFQAKPTTQNRRVVVVR